MDYYYEIPPEILEIPHDYDVDVNDCERCSMEQEAFQLAAQGIVGRRQVMNEYFNLNLDTDISSALPNTYPKYREDLPDDDF